VPTLDNVSVDLMVVLGTTTMPVHQVMRLSRGAIIELDATEADEVKILANNLPVASGACLSIATVLRSKSSECCRGCRAPVSPALIRSSLRHHCRALSLHP
jgi:flagellar motor switch protein FliN/FliY